MSKRDPASANLGLPLRIDAYPGELRDEVLAAAGAVLALDPLPAGEIPPVLRPGTALLPAGQRLLGISGRARAGKDTVAAYLYSRYADVVRMNFSDPIVDEANSWLSLHSRRITEANKSESPHRALLQAWGLARRAEDPDYWSHHIAASIGRAWERGARLVVVCGIRTADDLRVITDLGGEHWRVVRPGNAYRSDHRLETELEEHSGGFSELLNPHEGDLGALHGRIELMLARLYAADPASGTSR